MKNLVKEPMEELGLYDFILCSSSKLFHKLFQSDKEYVKYIFKKKLDRDLSLENPKSYNEKLQWLKFNWFDPLAIKCADKYNIRDFVKKRLGNEVLNDLFGVYDSVEEINIGELPKSFVLKATHGSNWNIICKNKNKRNWFFEFKKMESWLKSNYYWLGREWVYKDIKPRIICEEYLSDDDGKPLKDYKIFCFHGEPKFIQVDINRFTNHERNFYDLEWNFLDFEIEYPNNPSFNVPKPKSLQKMVRYSRILSKDFPHVRVDFFVDEKRLIFGELTFFHGSGWEDIKPIEWDYKIGSLIDLSIIPEEHLCLDNHA